MSTTKNRIRAFYDKALIQIGDFVEKRLVLTGGLILLSVTAIIAFTKLIFFKELDRFAEGVFVEATGMLFDILIFGILVVWLQKKAERRQKIDRYNEEIEEYLGVDSQEARARIVSRIKRLNKLNSRPGRLTNAILNDAHLVEANLKGAFLLKAGLKEAELHNADLQDAKLVGAILVGTVLTEANLEGANLSRADFKRTKLKGATLDNAILDSVHNVTAKQLCEAKSLVGIILKNSELHEEVCQKCPEKILQVKDPQV